MLNDIGLTQTKEPFEHLLTQGMVIKDGAKMSKSKGNVVDPDKIIKNYGAVSEQVCLAMLKNVSKIASTNISLSITGIAGPAGATKKKPVGLVYITLIHNEQLKTKEVIFFKDRLINKKF